jgi:hypothetical protein
VDEVLTDVRLGKGALRDRVGNAHVEGQATVELDLSFGDFRLD